MNDVLTGDRPKRQSIQPTYDHRETGDRFWVETRINGRRLNEVTTRDPFVYHRVVIGWRDLLRFVLRGRELTMIVGGDPEIVDDVMELDADCLTTNSTRRDEWNERIRHRLHLLTDSADVPVEKGMVLLIREPERNGLPERFKLWTVSSVRKTAKGASLKLLGWTPGILMEATATFPDGLVKEPWQVFGLSQRDLKLVYSRGEKEAAPSVDYAEKENLDPVR